MTAQAESSGIQHTRFHFLTDRRQRAHTHGLALSSFKQDSYELLAPLLVGGRVCDLR
jgi:hypothetical protein